MLVAQVRVMPQKLDGVAFGICIKQPIRMLTLPCIAKKRPTAANMADKQRFAVDQLVKTLALFSRRH